MKNIDLLDELIEQIGKNLEEQNWSIRDDEGQFSEFANIVRKHIEPYIDLRDLRFKKIQELKEQIRRLENANV